MTPLREFVISVDTAHIRSADSKTARDFEIVIARCGRGGRGTPPGHYFATTNTSQLEMRARTLQALQFEGYSGHGEVTILSDGAEIMKRLPKALPKPTTHIIDWLHLAMMQQIADHIVGSRPILCGTLAVIDEEIKALKWKLWHGQVERAICVLEKIVEDMNELGRRGDFSAARLNSLGQQLLTYIRSNRTALVDYGARYRAGRRVSTSLAESAVNSLVSKRMVKNQQMRWSPSGAHLILQVRAAMVNGNLRHRLREKSDLPVTAPPPDLSANPAFAQSRIKPQSFCRSRRVRVTRFGTFNSRHMVIRRNTAGPSTPISLAVQITGIAMRSSRRWNTRELATGSSNPLCLTNKSSASSNRSSVFPGAARRWARRSGRIEARTGLRMMPTSPQSPLTFRTAGFPRYG
jgi:hypothetical protein